MAVVTAPCSSEVVLQRGGEGDAAATPAQAATDALMRAVVLCDEDAALEALEACGESGVGRTERETGYTALHHACEYGLGRLVTSLVARGAPLDARTKDLILQKAVVQPGGQTPLHLAARSGEAAVVELLLNGRADPRARDIDSMSAAAAAALRGRASLAARLAEAAGEVLPPSAALESLAAEARDAGRRRAALQLEVPDHLRHAYTLEAVWTAEECGRVLAAVQTAAAARACSSGKGGGDADCRLVGRDHEAPAAPTAPASGWTTERHTAYATTDLPCSAVPEVDAWVRGALRARVLPRLARRHGWLPAPRPASSGSLAASPAASPTASSAVPPAAPRPEDAADGSRLAFRDLFFVRYSAAPGAQPGLALHRDGSVVSFNILLNDPAEFDGGGTYIEADDYAYQINRGDCFVHSGKLRHGGHPITRGERFVLVGFVDVLEHGERLEDFDS